MINASFSLFVSLYSADVVHMKKCLRNNINQVIFMHILGWYGRIVSIVNLIVNLINL